MPNKRGVKINRRWEIFVKFNKRRIKINGGGRNFKISVNIRNESKKRHKWLILMLSLKVSKQTRSEASKNKVTMKRVSNMSIN